MKFLSFGLAFSIISFCNKFFYSFHYYLHNYYIIIITILGEKRKFTQVTFITKLNFLPLANALHSNAFLQNTSVGHSLGAISVMLSRWPCRLGIATQFFFPFILLLLFSINLALIVFECTINVMSHVVYVELIRGLFLLLYYI